MKRLTLCASIIAALLLMALSNAALAGRGDAPPAPVAPVEVDAICQERVSPGAGTWKVAGDCNRAYETIVFDGVTQYAFCLGAYGSGAIFEAPSGGCGIFHEAVTLTGDGSVAVCIAHNATGGYDYIAERGHDNCVADAVI